MSRRPLMSKRVAANTRVCSCSIQWFIVFNHLFHNCDLSCYLEHMNDSPPSFLIFNNLLLFDALYAICIYAHVCLCIRVFFLCFVVVVFFLFLSVWLNMSEGHTTMVCSIIIFCWSSSTIRKVEIKLETPSCDTTSSSKSEKAKRL